MIFCLYLLTTLVSPYPCRAEARRTVVAVQSVNTKPYDAALEGFREVLGNATVHRLILRERAGEDAVRAIRAASPDLVFAIGMSALSTARKVDNIPIVYAMVLEGADAFSGSEYVTGINLEIDPEKQMSMLLEALPDTRTIGVLYDLERTGPLVEKMRAAARRNQVVLLDEKVIRARSVPVSGMELMRKVDVFWMLPDTTVITPENVEFLLTLAMESATPVVSFSEKYVEMGALLSIGVDPEDIGRQAAEMAERVLSGAAREDVPGENARKAVLSINMKIARKLGIAFDQTVLNNARTTE